MTRDEELDAMDMEGKKSDVLSKISEHGAIRLTNKVQTEFWIDAVRELESDGLVVSQFIENYVQQYSYIIVRAA